MKGAPDLIVEVLSLSTGYYDLTKKRHTYEATGVKEYWIVDPKEKTVEVLYNQEGVFETIVHDHQQGDVALRLLDGFQIPLAKLFSF